MSLAARALTTTTGHPVLKLVLLAVATSTGFPTAADVSSATELTLGMTENALDDLCQAGHLTRHRDRSGPRFSLPDDGWSYTRADTEEEPAAAAGLPPTFKGLGMRLSSRLRGRQ